MSATSTLTLRASSLGLSLRDNQNIPVHPLLVLGLLRDLPQNYVELVGHVMRGVYNARPLRPRYNHTWSVESRLFLLLSPLIRGFIRRT